MYNHFVKFFFNIKPKYSCITWSLDTPLEAAL